MEKYSPEKVKTDRAFPRMRGLEAKTLGTSLTRIKL